MDEEKKESKDKKKLVYEQPRLVRLSGAGGAGQGCENGSGEDGICSDGNAAVRLTCSTGTGFTT